MASNPHSTTGNKRVVHEGPKNHILAFILSLVLTLLAFVVVLADVGRTFTIMFLLTLAFIQALVQLVIWMHMKDPGHGFPIVGMIYGFIFGMTGVISAIFWIWW